jgi:hypothetical protein
MELRDWIEIAGLSFAVGGAILGAFLRDRKNLNDRLEKMRTVAEEAHGRMVEIENNYLSRFKEVNFNIERLGDRFSAELHDHMTSLKADMDAKFISRGECSLLSSIRSHEK